MLALTLTISFNWWLIPAAITIVGIIASMILFSQDKHGYLAGLGAMLITSIIILPIISISWVVALAIAYLTK